MKKILYPASTRGSANFGWLQARYSFSFANYFDPDRIHFGKLRVLNDDIVAPSMGFGKHPHQNMEIITIPQEGALKHMDSMGNEGVIQSGDIQIMSAGSGVEHSEINANTDQDVKLFQIWVFPEEENVQPRYDQKKIANLIKTNQLSPVVKPRTEASNGDLWIHQQAWFNLGEFDTECNTTYNMHKPSHGTYIFVIEGQVSVSGETLSDRDAIGVWDTESIDIQVGANTRLLVIEVPMN